MNIHSDFLYKIKTILVILLPGEIGKLRMVTFSFFFFPLFWTIDNYFGTEIMFVCNFHSSQMWGWIFDHPWPAKCRYFPFILSVQIYKFFFFVFFTLLISKTVKSREYFVPLPFRLHKVWYFAHWSLIHGILYPYVI